MAKLRLLFEKTGTACYLSHLDLMRTFQRLFLRGGMLIRHSQGFHPHPIMSIVLPLPVGQSSVCELLDFEVDGDLSDLAQIPEKLNAGCPDGLRVLQVRPVTRPVRELAFVDATVRMIYDNGVPAGAIEQLTDLFARPELTIQKKTKRKELADIDVIPLIHSISFLQEENCLLARVIVSAQNPGLNPALLGTAIEKECPHCMADFISVHRNRVLNADLTEFR